MIDYEVISTGSQDGNCLRVENVLFDIGVSFKTIYQTLKKHSIKVVFISHKHSDHLNISTVKQISETFPWITFLINKDVFNKIKSELPDFKGRYNVIADGNKITIPSESSKYRSLVIQIFHTDHEKKLISNGYYGDKIFNGSKEIENFVFATDFWNVNNLPNKKIDYFFLEANYQEETFKKAKQEGILPLWSIQGTDRHLSRELSHEYYLKHRRNKNSKYIPLHKSSRMYNDYETLKSSVSYKKTFDKKEEKSIEYDIEDFL